MLLSVSEEPDYEPRVIAMGPDDATIERTVRLLAWHGLTFVTLRVDEDYILEASGRAEDGFAVRCVVRGAEHISATTVDSLDTIVAVLQSYRADDGRWTTLVEWEKEMWEDVSQGRGPAPGYSILIRLEPERLWNPDLDIRY